MLYPAQLHKEDINKKLISCWYNPKYSFYFSNEYVEAHIENNAMRKHSFVHLDKEGNVDGYFSYHYTNDNKSMTNLQLISFSGTFNFSFIKDVKSRIDYMFDMGCQRLEFWAFTDNPACHGYNNFIKKHGGHKVCELHRTAYFDGKYHDSCCYEILKEDYIK